MIDGTSTLSILLAEDDDVAAAAVVRSLQMAGLNFPLVWAEDGAQPLPALRGGDSARHVPRPYQPVIRLP